MDAYDRMVPRGLLAATGVLLTVGWGLYALDPAAWPGLTGALVQTALLVGNVALSAACPRAKRLLVRLLQRRLVNPVVRGLYALGLNPLGLVLLETRGRRSGATRRVPVGAVRDAGDWWVIAEHGLRAGWVRNVRVDPVVRLRVRVGLRHRWVSGVAEVLPADDALARQRRICGLHPLRLLNAATVRVLGTDLVTVRIRPLVERSAPAEVRTPVATP